MSESVPAPVISAPVPAANQAPLASAPSAPAPAEMAPGGNAGPVAGPTASPAYSGGRGPQPGAARVAIAMSGGVDSSVAAALLVEQGHDVVGVHMKLYDAPDSQHHRKACCTLDDSLDAREVCQRLGIPYYVVDYREDFRRTVMDYFVASYGQGRTPNPCLMCNQHLKHASLLRQVREFGCDYLATGHYARIVHNPGTDTYEIWKPRDRRKDQTYFLAGTPAAKLPRLMFPLADYEKPAARGLAQELDLITWDKPESQDICFVPKDYREFIAPRLPKAQPGLFVDRQGHSLGEHRGVPFYTIGQRRGLGISHPHPLYVIELDAEQNRVVLGPAEALLSQSMTVSAVNWLVPPPGMPEPPPESGTTGVAGSDETAGAAGTARKPVSAVVKIRYTDVGTPATITPTTEGGARVRFQRPVRAITPGQAAVFYRGDQLLGGGWIEGSADGADAMQETQPIG